MGKRAQQKKPPSGNARRPPQHTPQKQQQQQHHRHVGTVVGGSKHQPQNGPYLPNATTASSLSEPHYNAGFAMSSASQSSSSEQSQSTRGGHGNRRQQQQQQQQQQSMHPTPNKSYISSTSSSSNSHSTSAGNSAISDGSQKLYYTSPRIELPDAKIFPSSPVKRKSLQTVDDRWQTMSEQAGSHRQDSSVLHVSRRHMTPSVLKAGVLPQVANRILELHLRLEQAEDMLPEWLDVIAQKFQNLEHLVLTRDTTSPVSPSAQPSRLRRLYILYRLPHLISIDNVPVTNSERRLARPDDPNGHRVVSKDEWYHLGSADGGEQKKKSGTSRKSSSAKKPTNSNSKKRPSKQPTENTREFVQEHDDDASGDDHRMDDDNEYDEEEQGAALDEIVSDSGEGYELDLELADAIQRITEPKRVRSLSPSGGRRHASQEARPPTSPKKSTSNNKPLAKKQNKHDHTKSGKKMNGAAEGTKDYPSLEFVECDSTVTSTYGCGHWSGACFAPFQACSSGQRRKTKEAFVARTNKQHSKTNKKPTRQSVESVAQQIAADDEADYDDDDAPLSPPDAKGLPAEPPKSYKYSTLVDDTVQKQDQKHQRKLFRESTMTASHGGSTLPSSRRSRKYSTLLGKMNDHTGNRSSSSSDEDDDDGSHAEGRQQSAKHPQVDQKKLAKEANKKQPSPKSHSKSPTKSHKQQHQQQPRPKKQQLPPKKSAGTSMDEDDVGTMTGVSIAVVKDANSGMSVATIPSVLQRQEAKMTKLESKNLAARRNLAGVTIDVPLQTPSEARKEPRNKPNGKLKKVQNQTQKNASKKDPPQDPKPPKKDRPAASKETEKKEACKRVVPAVALNSMQDTMEGNYTMETVDGPTDPEIVDMVLNKLGRQTDTPSSIPKGAKTISGTKAGDASGIETGKCPDSDLQIPKLTSQSKDKEAAPPTRPVAGEVAVASLEAPSTKISNKVKTKQHQKKQQRKRHEDAKTHQHKEPNPASRSSSSRSEETAASECGARSKENFNELESRLNTLIHNTSKLPSSLKNSSIPPSPVVSPSPLSKTDQKIMDDTVSKLDQNLKDVLEMQQTSPINRRSRGRQEKGIQNASPVRQRQPTTVNSTSATEASPLEKLETTMAGLFATIMAQMSPPRRQLTSPANGSNPGPKREKKRDVFFSKETEKTLDRLAADKSNEDDSTLFVVEIQNKDVAESLTHDFGFQPGKDKIHIEAPSIVNLLEPSVQSSVTHLLLSQNHTQAALAALSPRSAVQLTDEINQQSNEVKDPTVIDLTDKSTIVDVRPAKGKTIAGVSETDNNGDQEVINLVDVVNQQLDQLKPGQLCLPSLARDAANSSEDNDTNGNAKAPGISQQGSKLGMVVNLPPIYENDANAAASASVEEEIDGNFVAAAAAGAAAGAEASGDNACPPSSSMDPNDPNDPNSVSAYDYMPTNNAVVGKMIGVDPRLPQEIVTADVAAAPSLVANPFPKEVVVQHDDNESEKSVKEPALIAELLTARPNDSSLSLLSRRVPLGYRHVPPCSSHIPKEVTATAYDQLDIARRDSPPSPNEGGPTLPREILALLEERGGLGPTSSGEAMDLLPSEIIMRIQNSYMAEDYHDPALSPASGPPREIRGTAMNQYHCQAPASPREYPTSMPEDIRAMLDQYDRRSKGMARGVGTDNENLVCAEGMPLLREVVAMQTRKVAEAESEEEDYGPYSSTGRYVWPSNEIGERQWYSKSKARLSKPVLSANNGSSTGDSAVDGAHPEGPSETERKPVATALFSRTSPGFMRNAGNDNNTENSARQDASVFRAPSLPSQVLMNGSGRSFPSKRDDRVLPHMGSLPSNVVVQQDSPVPTPNTNLPPSKSLSSPFPMQFRTRLAKALKVSTPPQGSIAALMEPSSQPSASQDLGASSTTVQNSLSEPSASALKVVPNQITVEPPQNQYSKPPPSPKKNSPTAKHFTKSVASPLLQLRAKKSAARSSGDLPPHNPASNRRSVSSISPRSGKMNRAISRWKEQRSARSSSIMDEYDDVDEEEDGDAGQEMLSYSDE